MSNSKSVKEIFAVAVDSIPEGKKSFGYQLVIVPCLGAGMKQNSSNNAKTVNLPGGMMTLPEKASAPFLKTRNVWIVKGGKMYRRSQEETPLQLRMNLTTSMLSQILDDPTEDSTGARQLTQKVQSKIAQSRGQLHIVCFDHVQAEIKTPTYKAEEFGEHEEMVITTNAVFSIRFVEESSDDYIHRVDMPSHVNNRNLGDVVSDNDKPQLVDAFASRSLSRKQVINLMKSLIENEKEFLQSASLSEVQEKIGSTRKEVETLWQEFLADQTTEEVEVQTEAMEAGLEMSTVESLMQESGEF